VICRVLDVARSTAYYHEHDRAPIVDEVLAQRIKHLIAEPYLGYGMVWARLRRQGLKINRKAVQRLMPLKGWPCHRRLKKRCSPRVESSPRVTTVSDVRLGADATYVWTRFELVYVNAVLGCADRECIGLNVSQRNEAREAAWVLEEALIRRFGLAATPTSCCALTTRWCMLLSVPRPRGVIRPAPRVHSATHTRAEGRRRIVMGTLKLKRVSQHRFGTYDEAKAAIRLGSRTTTSRDRIRASTISRRRNGATAGPN
jgi:hypothetical protein